jgi:hypothetical protein
MAQAAATAASFIAIRRKNPPCNSLISTLIQTGGSAKKIARLREGGKSGGVLVGGNGF